MRPSQLGALMTAAGIMLLAVTIFVHHTVPATVRVPADAVVRIFLLQSLGVLFWALWLAGAALICVGVWRIMTIDFRDP